MLNEFAIAGGEAAAAGARFEITINLGSDHIEHYSKSITPDPHDIDPENIDVGMIAAITAKKTESGGGQGHL